MKAYLKAVYERIKKDWQENKHGIIAALSCLIIFTLLFRTVCPLRLITGYPCPGCGITRASFCLLRLDFAGAFSLNPSVFLWAGLAACLVISRYLLGRNKRADIALIIVSFLTIGIYIYRMAVLFPGDEPLLYYPKNLIAFLGKVASAN